MAQTITVVYTIPTPAVTGTHSQADVDFLFRNLLGELQSRLSPSYSDGNPVVLTSITLS